MDDAIQLYTDGHYPWPVVQGLRRRGANVPTTQEARLIGASDDQQLAFATGQERVIATFDTDCLAIHQKGVEHAGIIWRPERWDPWCRLWEVQDLYQKVKSHARLIIIDSGRHGACSRSNPAQYDAALLDLLQQTDHP